jgi:hypothetical protein
LYVTPGIVGGLDCIHPRAQQVNLTRDIVRIRMTLKRQISGNGKRFALHSLPERFHDPHTPSP